MSINISKSVEFFNPADVTERCHIIGCGAGGSAAAELLTRLGLTKIVLYDFDIVNPHNIANQLFTQRDIGDYKTEAVARMMADINPDLKQTLEIHTEGWKSGMPLDGYVFLCVDNIDLRRQIATENKFNQAIKVMFDFRTGLTTGQHYAAVWENLRSVKNFIDSMDFTHEEAKASTPVTACGMELGVAPTVRLMANLGVANFINYVKTGSLKKFINIDAFGFDLTAC